MPICGINREMFGGARTSPVNVIIRDLVDTLADTASNREDAFVDSPPTSDAPPGV